MTKPKPRDEKQRDPDRTRAALVESARKIFAEQGIDGARLADIARDAGVSTALIYHHFGGKERLFCDALEAEVLDLRLAQSDLDLRHLDPMDGLTRLVETTFDYFAQNPGVIAFLNIENRLGGRHMRGSEAAIDAYDPLLETVRMILDEGAARGQMRADLDPLDLYLSIAGMGYHFIANRHTLGAVFQRDFTRPGELARRRAQIVAFVRHAVAP